MSRRTALAGLGGLALGVAQAKPTRQRVIVIGAGVGGLAAAHDLTRAGVETIVLEARNRTGGRIHTSRAWEGVPVDLGASWIHGQDGNPLTALADAASARRVETSYDRSTLRDANGQEIDPDLKSANALVERALAAAFRLKSDIPVMQAIKRSRDWARADPQLRRLVRYVVNITLEHEYGGPAHELSAWHGADGQEFGGADALFPDGYDRIPKYLARGLDIRLGQRVTQIGPGFVGLAGGGRLTADRIVCTVPLGVLRAGSIRFAERLSAARQAAIGALRMGLLNKCWLRFDRPAWPADLDLIGWLGPKPGVWAEWVSLSRSTGAPVLVGFNAADQAAEIERLGDAETVASARKALRAMFGNAFPEARAAQITRWGRDDFSQGSYSFNAVGTSGRTRAALAGPDWDGALWFAGEAASPDYYGTVHGALLSGREAARAILAEGKPARRQ
jgi:monoamine oxidase